MTPAAEQTAVLPEPPSETAPPAPRTAEPDTAWPSSTPSPRGRAGAAVGDAVDGDEPRDPLVSIVIATYNRLARLQRCIAAVRANVGISHETIVVGGGGADGTAEWLAEQRDLRFIRETGREGCTRAYNKGFRAARGTYVMWLNDDSYPLPGAVEQAVAMIERPDLGDVGMIAFYHNLDREWNRLDSVEHGGFTYSVYNVRGTPYANFGLLRRGLLERLGYLDDRYYFCAWDPDLALKVQRQAGLKVIGCRKALVYHEELIDERKCADLPVIEVDHRKFFEKWPLPEKFSYPDPGPAYRAMLADRGLL
ncbi:MAG: hypothetical protein AMXMBFR83_16260 [Phycisphaerae bacterium]